MSTLQQVPAPAHALLILHDEEAHSEFVAARLEREGFRVTGAPVQAWPPDPASALEVAPDLAVVILSDIRADASGEVGRLRRAFVGPLIIIAPGGTSAGARVLDAGADDFVDFPSDVDELAARVGAVLRRVRSTAMDGSEAADPSVLVIGDVELDLERRMCRRAGRVVALARSEWQVLTHLARHRGRVVIATDLLRSSWGPDYTDDLQILRICISRLRRKLGASGRQGPIKTYHNVGYALEG
ncbi:MAG: response regulator transcription factor [Chloroflexi bacterium]|nr:response regulator transcription factor [Chloroflexota bacterium]